MIHTKPNRVRSRVIAMKEIKEYQPAIMSLGYIDAKANSDVNLTNGDGNYYQTELFTFLPSYSQVADPPHIKRLSIS